MVELFKKRFYIFYNKNKIIKKINRNVFKKKQMKKIAELLTQSSYNIYHKSLTSAVDQMQKFIAKNNLHADKQQMANDIGLGPSKPSQGKTNKYHIDLYDKSDKLQKKKLHAQVYGMGNGSYQLNMYIA